MIKNLPKSKLPREKLSQKDSNTLTNVEILSIILKPGTSGKNVKELSAEILNSYPLSSLSERSTDNFKEFSRVSKLKSEAVKGDRRTGIKNAE